MQGFDSRRRLCFQTSHLKRAQWRVGALSERKACQLFFERFELLGINQLCKFKCIFFEMVAFYMTHFSQNDKGQF